MRRLYVIFCEFWNRDEDQPEGSCRDLGSVHEGSAPTYVLASYRHAEKAGWGCGEVVLTDRQGRRVDLPAVQKKLLQEFLSRV